MQQDDAASAPRRPPAAISLCPSSGHGCTDASCSHLRTFYRTSAATSFANRRQFICFRSERLLIQVEQPWSRATPAGARTGAVYLTVTNKSHNGDRLLGVSSDVADKSQIHEMKVVDEIMEMREVSNGLPVPAGGSVVLKPGSSHVMLIGLKKPLTAGETIPLTLDFEKAGKVSITVPVRAMGAGHDDMPGMDHMDKK